MELILIKKFLKLSREKLIDLITQRDKKVFEKETFKKENTFLKEGEKKQLFQEKLSDYEKEVEALNNFVKEAHKSYFTLLLLFQNEYPEDYQYYAAANRLYDENGNEVPSSNDLLKEIGKLEKSDAFQTNDGYDEFDYGDIFSNINNPNPRLFCPLEIDLKTYLNLLNHYYPNEFHAYHVDKVNDICGRVGFRHQFPDYLQPHKFVRKGKTRFLQSLQSFILRSLQTFLFERFFSKGQFIFSSHILSAHYDQFERREQVSNARLDNITSPLRESVEADYVSRKNIKYSKKALDAYFDKAYAPENLFETRNFLYTEQIEHVNFHKDWIFSSLYENPGVILLDENLNAEKNNYLISQYASELMDNNDGSPGHFNPEEMVNLNLHITNFGLAELIAHSFIPSRNSLVSYSLDYQNYLNENFEGEVHEVGLLRTQSYQKNYNNDIKEKSFQISIRRGKETPLHDNSLYKVLKWETRRIEDKLVDYQIDFENGIEEASVYFKNEFRKYKILKTLINVLEATLLLNGNEKYIDVSPSSFVQAIKIGLNKNYFSYKSETTNTDQTASNEVDFLILVREFDFLTSVEMKQLDFLYEELVRDLKTKIVVGKNERVVQDLGDLYTIFSINSENLVSFSQNTTERYLRSKLNYLMGQLKAYQEQGTRHAKKFKETYEKIEEEYRCSDYHMIIPNLNQGGTQSNLQTTYPKQKQGHILPDLSDVSVIKKPSNGAKPKQRLANDMDLTDNPQKYIIWLPLQKIQYNPGQAIDRMPNIIEASFSVAQNSSNSIIISTKNLQSSQQSSYQLVGKGGGFSSSRGNGGSNSYYYVNWSGGERRWIPEGAYDHQPIQSDNKGIFLRQVVSTSNNHNRGGFWSNSIQNTARVFNNNRGVIGNFVSSPLPSMGTGYASNIILSANGVNPRDADLTSSFIGGFSYPVFIWFGFALRSPLGFRGMNKYAARLVGQQIGQTSKIIYEAAKYGGSNLLKAVGRGTQIAGRGFSVLSSACNSSSAAYVSSVAAPYIPVMAAGGLVLLWGHSIPQGYASSREEIYALLKTNRISVGQAHEALSVGKNDIVIYPRDIFHKGLYSLYDTGQGTLLYHDHQGKFKILHPNLMIKAPQIPTMNDLNSNQKKTVMVSKN